MGINIYLKSFVFEATRFEEYRNGACVKAGDCQTSIVAKIMNRECIGMMFLNDRPININHHFGFPIFGVENGDILADRIQYGRLPDSLNWNDPNEPIVCNIFNNQTCIRFALLSPLRIVDFFGKFVEIRDF